MRRQLFISTIARMFKTMLFVCLVAGVLAAPQQKKEPVAIVSEESVMNLDGSFRYSYEGADGSKATQEGVLKKIGDQEGETVKGSFSYVGDDGKNYAVSYIADENGYVATGDHLPVAPPIPEAIARSLKFIEASAKKL